MIAMVDAHQEADDHGRNNDQAGDAAIDKCDAPHWEILSCLNAAEASPPPTPSDIAQTGDFLKFLQNS
jgi:hypothetical protein